MHIKKYITVKDFITEAVNKKICAEKGDSFGTREDLKGF